MTKEEIKNKVMQTLNSNGTFTSIDNLGRDLGIKLSMDDFAHEISDFITDALDGLKDVESHDFWRSEPNDSIVGMFWEMNELDKLSDIVDLSEIKQHIKDRVLLLPLVITFKTGKTRDDLVKIAAENYPNED